MFGSRVEPTNLCKSSLFLLLLAGIFQNELIGAGLLKLWGIDLKNAIQGSMRENGSSPVVALRFSPDGRRVAAIVKRESAAKQEGQLLIFDIQHPLEKPLQYRINNAPADGDDGRDTINFAWLPSGDAINLAGSVISLSGGSGCELPWGSAFFSSEDAIAKDPADASYTRDWRVPFSHFLILNTHCQIVGRWEVAEDWYIEDASIDRGLICIAKHYRMRFGEFMEDYMIVDPLTGRTLWRWPRSAIPTGYRLRFAYNGKAVCGGTDSDAAEKVPVGCWDVDTGKMIAEAPTINGGVPFATAARVSRIIASDFRYVHIPFSTEYREEFKRRVVWDFKTGKELAAWRPQSQEYEGRPTIPPTRSRELLKFDISPDGKYIVEGGNGTLRLYEIVP